MTSLVLWGFWALFTAIVMVVDRNLRVDEDFTPTPTGYFVLAAISPFIVLPIYFFTSRRNSAPRHRALGALAGVMLTTTCVYLASLHTTAVVLLAHLA